MPITFLCRNALVWAASACRTDLRGAGRVSLAGLNTLRRTASNVNDLMFSSSSLASGLAKDLRAYIYGDSCRTPQSLRRLIVLMSSSEVQQTLHGTAHAILAAFFAARRREADKLAAQGNAKLCWGPWLCGDRYRSWLSFCLGVRQCVKRR